ncbi:hypothetical protein RFI_05447, partial [Reticulomyxa filosa]
GSFKKRKEDKFYNSYPVDAGYFGSYCMDGLAMALHGVYHSKSFGESIERVVNLLGDADTTGSIAGQIAGSYYGYRSIISEKDSAWMFENLKNWDGYRFALSGVLCSILGTIYDHEEAKELKTKNIRGSHFNIGNKSLCKIQ